MEFCCPVEIAERTIASPNRVRTGESTVALRNSGVHVLGISKTLEYSSAKVRGGVVGELILRQPEQNKGDLCFTGEATPARRDLPILTVPPSKLSRFLKLSD